MFHSAGCPGGDAFGSKRYTLLLCLADPRHMRPSKVRSPCRINAFFRLKTMWVFSPRSQICPTEKRGLSRSVERFARIGSIDWEILMEADPDDGIRSPDAVMVPSPLQVVQNLRSGIWGLQINLNSRQVGTGKDRHRYPTYLY